MQNCIPEFMTVLWRRNFYKISGWKVRVYCKYRTSLFEKISTEAIFQVGKIISKLYYNRLKFDSLPKAKKNYLEKIATLFPLIEIHTWKNSSLRHRKKKINKNRWNFSTNCTNLEKRLLRKNVMKVFRERNGTPSGMIFVQKKLFSTFCYYFHFFVAV